MRRRERRRNHVSHERWLVSYADFVTLLFAFFVVLYASSKADQKKQQEIAQAINSAFRALAIFPDTSRRLVDLKNVSAINPTKTNPDQAITPLNIVMGEDVLAPVKITEDLDQLQKLLEKMLSDQIAQHTVAIRMGRDGLVISLREAGFFDSGSAIPHPDTLPVLRRIAEALGKTLYDVRIEGHTDNVPIHNAEFDSNWELSAARATRIAHILLDSHSILPERLSAAGYAEYHPVATNETSVGRAENRRVDLVVMPRMQGNLAAPDNNAPKGSWRKITE
jgi:chemotaxis protein MotB